jgi:hypothetical protein
MIKQIVRKITLEMYFFEYDGRGTLSKITTGEHISTLVVSFNS